MKASSRTPRGMPTASPIVREVDELDEAEVEGEEDVSEAATAPDVVTVEASSNDEFELVVCLCAFAVVVLVMVVVGGRGGQRLPAASNTPRNSPGMKLNSCDGEQHVSLPLPQQ